MIPKARPDPPQEALVDHIEVTPAAKERDTSPAIVATIQPTAPAVLHPIPIIEDPPRPLSRNRESSVERCSGCGETWRRPLFDSSNLMPTTTDSKRTTLGQGSLVMLNALNDHGRKADAHYSDWKWEHSHCVKSVPRHRSSSPYHAAFNAALQEQDRAEATTTQKRKAEQLYGNDHDSVTKKGRMVYDPTTVPAQPSTST